MQINRKIFQAHKLEELILFKMFILSKAVYKVKAVLIKVLKTEMGKSVLNSKLCMEPRKTPNSERNLEKGEQTGGITLPDLKLYYKTIVIKTDGSDIKQIQRYRDRIKSPEIIYSRAVTNIQWGMDSLFNKWCWENWISTCKRMKSGSSFHLHKSTYTFTNQLKMD